MNDFVGKCPIFPTVDEGIKLQVNKNTYFAYYSVEKMNENGVATSFCHPQSLFDVSKPP